MLQTLPASVVSLKDDNMAARVVQAGQQLTAVRFDGSGLQCAVGTSGGLVALYDLRMSKPTAVRDHMYGQPIRDIKFHQPASSAGHMPTPACHQETLIACTFACTQSMCATCFGRAWQIAFR